jgi:cell wall-associated NlpC family hydrolase
VEAVPAPVIPPKPDHAPTITRDHGKHVQTEAVIIVPVGSGNRDVANTGPLDVAKPVRKNKGSHRLAAVATGGLLIVGAGTTGAIVKHEDVRTSQLAVIPTGQVGSDLETEIATATATTVEDTVITAAPDAKLTVDEVKVETVAAPAPVIPEPVIVPVVESAAPKPAPVPASPTVNAPVSTPPPVLGRNQMIVSAALAQIGVMQDCTMLVTNSLAAVGIHFHGWPHEYYALGTAVSAADAVPGDLIYYVNGSGASVSGLAHIAVYIGNGQAVHGGWNGNETRVFSVNVGSGPLFIRLR